MTPMPGTGTPPASPTSTLGAGSAPWRLLAFWASAAIVLLSIAWEWQLAPLRAGGSLLVLKAVPLAVLLPGLAQGRVRSFQITSMLILAYLAEGVVRGISDLALSSALGWIEATLSALVFAAVLAYVRSLRAAASPSAQRRS